jgi:hypothetical protein
MSRLLSRLIDGEDRTENEAVAYIGGALIGVVAAYVVLAIAFGVGYLG